MAKFDVNNDELWGLWDGPLAAARSAGECQACDVWGRVDDMALCENCAAMLERDLIRQREWDYAASTFGLPSEAREELRRQVMAQFGAALELIAPPTEARKDRSPRK